ncbi:MAG TPA: peptidylprolyl isomerase [Stellaceae bacterium]|nr:peptidylprolyl isomerase [Stellaceae bacterium]
MPALRYSGALLLTLAVLCLAIPSAWPANRTAVPPPAPKGQPTPGTPPGAVPDMRIAAVVNDEVISVFDLESRIRLVMLSSNTPDSAEARKKIETEVLRSLVDERLELQEAKKQNVVATDDEINSALGKIEKQNNMQPGQLNEFLKSRGIDRESLINQVKASIVWAKLVRRKAAETVEISDEEVDAAMKRIKEHAGEPQSRIAEIFLAVDNPSQDADVRALAEKLTDQMKQGARFSAIAQQFSQSATAAVGGDLGWLRPDQLAPDLAKAAASLKPGELSPPIRTGGGYYLLLVLDRRNGDTGGGQTSDTVYDVVQVVFPLPPNPNEAMKRNAAIEANGLRQTAKNCADLLRMGKEKSPQMSSEGEVNASTVAPQMRTLLDKLSPNQASEPILQRNGIGVIMLCSKQTKTADKGSGTPNRDEVFDSLLREKLDTVSRQYLRDLRRAAYVDVRV